MVKRQLKMMNIQGDHAPAKRQRILKKFENSSTKTIAKQSMSSQTPLGSVMEFAVKFAPRLLINDQKQQCVNVCLEL
jgi:hypothetical protein